MLTFRTLSLVNQAINESGFPLVNLNIPEISSERYRVIHDIKPKGERLDVIPARLAFMTGQHPAAITLEQDYPVVILSEKEKGCWVNTMPQEIYTQLYPALAFHGRVLIGGLGLGVVINMMKMVPRPKTQILVVEKDKEIIDLISGYYPDVAVIHGDISEVLDMYATEPIDKKFDFIYLDTWTGTGEATYYEEVLPLRKKAMNCLQLPSLKNIYCWMEEVMFGQIIHGIELRLMMGDSGTDNKLQVEFTGDSGIPTSYDNIWGEIPRNFFQDTDLRHLRLMKNQKKEQYVRKYVITYLPKD